MTTETTMGADDATSNAIAAERADRLAKFGQGEWLDEPDRVEFKHAGFACLIQRGPSGALCGYVGVPPEHRWHGKYWGDVDASVHGGVTYAEACDGLICHVPDPGEPEHLFWIGFDCAHYRDIAPKHAMFDTRLGMHSTFPGQTYKNIAYVRAETERLAEQAAEATK